MPAHILQRTNVSFITKMANRELALRYGVREYPTAKWCGQCGTKNMKRRLDGTCLACVQKESRGQQ
jgi:hypothetical protein